jgi:hypothetical protein
VTASKVARRRVTTEKRLGADDKPFEASLFLLEPLARELKRPAVLGHRAHDVIRRAGRNLGLDLERHRHFRTDEAGEVHDHLVGDAARVTSSDLGDHDGAICVITMAEIRTAGMSGPSVMARISKN